MDEDTTRELCEMVSVVPYLVMLDDGEYGEDYRDVYCTGEATGTHERSVRVCRECGEGLEEEGFEIVWDR